MNYIEYIELALAFVGAAAIIVKGLAEVAKITPSTKDDKYAGYLVRGVGYVAYVLDVISGGLKKDQARKD